MRRRSGIPHSSAKATLDLLRKQIPGAAAWRAFETVIEQIARELDDSPTRVNYADRRRAMADWELPQEDWVQLCSDLPKLRRLAAGAGPPTGTVFIWA